MKFVKNRNKNLLQCKVGRNLNVSQASISELMHYTLAPDTVTSFFKVLIPPSDCTLT